MNNECIEQVQKQIDYQFDEPKLLRQAFTRRSYAQEHPGTQDNEVLELYGDKALEFIVMKKLSYYYGSDTNNGKYCSEKNEGQLTEIKKALVEAGFDKDMIVTVRNLDEASACLNRNQKSTCRKKNAFCENRHSWFCRLFDYGERR